MEWQPIETAPKDGQRVILYRPLAHNTNDYEIDIKRSVSTNQGCWFDTVPEGMTAENYTDGYCRPTHWMPLPLKPE